MREIKFRAWDGKKMRYSFRLSSLDGTPSLLSREENANIENPNWIIMQFTGLHDKNGKEIYEGDLLKALDGRLSSVEYEAPHFILRHHLEGGSDFIAVKNHFEIIGNIYESPELIN